MKKLVSLMALSLVLLGAVMMVTGCGTKPAKGSVWKVIEGDPEGVVSYWCFHSDGNIYTASKRDGKLISGMLGPYTIEAKKITVAGSSFDYTIRGEKMTVTFTEDGKPTTVVLQKSTDYTETQIKDAFVKQ